MTNRYPEPPPFEPTGRTEETHHYRGYTITLVPKPIPIYCHDWEYVHDDYDGAIDSIDWRCGTGASLEECKQQIDEMEDDE